MYWIISAASLIGVWLNIKKQVACFYIWAVTNISWMIVDYMHGIYAQSALQMIYVGLSIYGIIKWRNKGPITA